MPKMCVINRVSGVLVDRFDIAERSFVELTLQKESIGQVKQFFVIVRVSAQMFDARIDHLIDKVVTIGCIVGHPLAS